MKSKDLIILVAALVFVAFRLYQKYVRKDTNGSKQQSGNQSLLKRKSLADQTDDYEPYSKKEKGNNI